MKHHHVDKSAVSFPLLPDKVAGLPIEVFKPFFWSTPEGVPSCACCEYARDFDGVGADRRVACVFHVTDEHRDGLVLRRSSCCRFYKPDRDTRTEIAQWKNQLAEKAANGFLKK